MVDGGSSDATVAVCQSYDVVVVESQCGRGAQLDTGARAAVGVTLLFLHADSRLTPEHCRVAVATAAGSVLAGGFHLQFDYGHPILRFAQMVNKVRFRATRILYGDHGLFLLRRDYQALGGFSKQALFEDIEFSRRLKKAGEVVLVEPVIITSARRFRAGGVIRTYLKMASLHVVYALGISPDRLAKWYSLNSGQN